MNNLTLTLRGHLRSKVVTSNERSYVTSYRHTIVTLSLSSTIVMVLLVAPIFGKVPFFKILPNCQNSKFPKSVYKFEGPPFWLQVGTTDFKIR